MFHCNLFLSNPIILQFCRAWYYCLEFQNDWATEMDVIGNWIFMTFNSLRPNDKFHWNLDQNLYIFIQENALKIIVCEMAAILSQTQCVTSQMSCWGYLILQQPTVFPGENYIHIKLFEWTWIEKQIQPLWNKYNLKKLINSITAEISI